MIGQIIVNTGMVFEDLEEVWIESARILQQTVLRQDNVCVSIIVVYKQVSKIARILYPGHAYP